MTKLKRPELKHVQMRYVGVNTFMKLPLIEDLNDLGDEKADYAILGIPEDCGGFYRPGGRFAPNFIREQSQMLRPYHVNLKANVLEDVMGFDNGDVHTIPNRVDYNVEKSVERIQALAERGITPIMLGGDHSITIASLKALSRVHGPLGLVHFDSHIDTQQEFLGSKFNNGTSLYQGVTEGWIDPSRTISIGIKGTQFVTDETYRSRDLGIEVITMDEFEEIGVKETINRINKRVGNKEKTFLTFDIDCVDPAFAPGGALYELGGFTTREIVQLINGLQNVNFIGFDIAEVVPAYDPSGITGYMAAALVHTFVALIAVNKRHKQEER